MRLVAPLLMILTAACTVGEPSAARPAPGQGVEALIGDAACDADAQCHTIAVGAKACGGPARYLAWSSRVTDGAALQSVADRETRAARASVEKSGILSNCAMVTDPGAFCAAPTAAEERVASTTSERPASMRRCQLRPAGIGGASKIY